MHPNSLFFIHHNSKYRISVRVQIHHLSKPEVIIITEKGFSEDEKKKKLLNLKPKKSHSAPGFRILTLKNFLYRPMGRFDICFGGLKTQWQTQRVQPWDYWLHIMVDQHIENEVHLPFCLPSKHCLYNTSVIWFFNWFSVQKLWLNKYFINAIWNQIRRN